MLESNAFSWKVITFRSDLVESLNEYRVDSRYSRTIRYVYENATQISSRSEEASRLGDTISLKLITSTLEDVIKKFDWSEMGINMNGNFLNHLSFADDNILITLDLAVEILQLELYNTLQQ